MRPVDQTTFGHPGGNCFSACVASLMHLEIDSVPYFMGEPGEAGHLWAGRLDAWLAPRGLYALHFDADETHTIWPSGFYILVGKSPRGDHAVIARGNAVVHDPHPLRERLVKIEGFTLLVPLFGDIVFAPVPPPPSTDPAFLAMLDMEFPQYAALTEGPSRCVHSSPACNACVEADTIAAHST